MKASKRREHDTSKRVEQVGRSASNAVEITLIAGTPKGRKVL